MQPFVWGAGGTYFDQDVLPTKADFTNPGMRAAYGFMREWAQNDWMNTEELSGTKDRAVDGLAQCAGMDGSTNLTMQLRANDPDTDWRVRAARLPGRPASAGQLRRWQRADHAIHQQTSQGSAGLHAVADRRARPAPQVGPGQGPRPGPDRYCQSGHPGQPRWWPATRLSTRIRCGGAC